MDETNKNDTGKQWDDQIEKTRRPTRRTSETEGRDGIGERVHRQPIKEIKHTRKKNIKSTHSSPDPLTAYSPSPAGLE